MFWKASNEKDLSPNCSIYRSGQWKLESATWKLYGTWLLIYAKSDFCIPHLHIRKSNNPNVRGRFDWTTRSSRKLSSSLTVIIDSEMDDASNEVVLSLQLDDLNRLLDANTQVKEQKDIPDSLLALVTYRDELATRLGLIRDRRMGRSMARAVLQDDTALREARVQENGAIRDRLAASHLARVGDVPHPAPLIDLTDDSDDVAITGFAMLNSVAQTPDVVEIDPIPARPIRHHRHNLRSGASLCPPRSSLVPSAEPANRESLFGVGKTCVACNAEVSYTSAVYAPCGHDYCKDCAKQIFVNAARDESLFPPRCCRQPIPLAAVDVFLDPAFITHFEEKSVEYMTPDRLYCSWPTCSAFIPPSSINGETAVCPKCGYWVCTLCKGPTHQGRDCPEDGALNDLIETAHGAGWQRCYQCNRFVELSLGCNHIT